MYYTPFKKYVRTVIMKVSGMFAFSGKYKFQIQLCRWYWPLFSSVGLKNASYALKRFAMLNIYFDIILPCILKPELCFMLDTCEQFSDISQRLFGNYRIICAKPLPQGRSHWELCIGRGDSSILQTQQLPAFTSPRKRWVPKNSEGGSAFLGSAETSLI